VANVGVVAAVWIALVGVPAGLIVQNLPIIWANAGKAMSRLAQHSVASLPPEGAYVLSDNSFSLFSVQYELLKAHTEKKYVLVDTTQLAASGYHRFMQKRHADRWPEFRRPNDPKAMVDPFALIGLLGQMSERGKVYYLHPSFGYYFEVYYPTPHGLTYELKPFQDPKQASPPRLTPAELLEEDKFWESIRATDLDPLIKEAEPFRKISKGKPKPKTLGTYLAEYYSRSVDEFGVQAQRAGDLVLAAKHFDLALRLNPANPSAYVNQEYNRALQNHTATNYTFSQAAFDRTEMYGNRWDGILAANGPPDEPTACIFVSDSFQNGMNFRQAAQYLERVVYFDPTDRTAQINCMMMYVKAVMPDLALKRLEEFRARFSGSALKEDEDMDLIAIEAWARVTKNDLPKAESLLLNAQRQHPKQPGPWDTLSDIYMRVGQATNALQVLERQLQAQPESPRALVNYAVMLINLDRTAEALPYLERSLRLTPNDELALLNRGIANLRLERLDGAESDFLALLSSARSQYKVIVLYHLADTYFRKKNRRESLKFYHDFIKAAPPTTPEVQKAKERVRTLESGAGF
jgi:tetratricopeptide (TPR) repeat protein